MREKLKRRGGMLCRIGTFLTVFLGCFAVLHFVTPSGDDFFYGRWGNLGPAEFLGQIAQHYMRANGRNLVHMIDGVLLGSDLRIGLARVFIALLLGSIALNGLRLSDTKDHRTPALAAFWICGLFLLPIYLTRQGVYWITGAMNYVLPLALFMEYWVLLRDSMAEKRGWRATVVFAVLTGLTTEQISVMAVGLPVLMLLRRLMIEKKKLPRAVWWALGLAFAGMVSVVAAPGNFFRASITAPPVEGGALAMVRFNVMNLRRSFLFGDTLYPIHFIVMLAVPAYLFARALRQKKWTHGVAALAGTAVFAVWLKLPQWDKSVLSYGEVAPQVERAFLAVLVGYLLVTLYASIAAARQKDWTPLFAWVLGVGSQVMMLVSPTVGSRTMLCFVGAFLLMAACLIREAPYLYLLVAGCMLGWHWGYALMAAVFAIAAALWLFRKYCPARRLAAVLCCVPLLFCGWLMLKDTFDGFRLNALYDAQNRARIAAYDGGETLTLRKLPKELYGWVMPYHNDYYDVYFKEYYGLPRKTELIWE